MDVDLSLRGKKVVVVGLALTGVAVAKFCVKRGARVVVTDGRMYEAAELWQNVRFAP
jgi:UDP-N-acetylmuramoylalanine--D-glutamate ligase